MNATERVWYILLYGYVAFGLGYYLKKGFSVHQERDHPLSSIGIVERIPTSIDHLFDETGITRLD